VLQARLLQGGAGGAKKTAVNLGETAAAVKDGRNHDVYFLDTRSDDIEVIPTEPLDWGATVRRRWLGFPRACLTYTPLPPNGGARRKGSV